jgi:hypothetical protein
LKNRCRIHKLVAVILGLLLVAANPLAAFSAGGNLSGIKDNELVLTTFDANGNVSGIQVLNHLRISGEGQVQVTDKSAYSLTSLRNLYGKEKLVVQDGQIAINTQVEGLKDIYYLATLDQSAVKDMKFPVNIDIQYFLDGQQVKPAELLGKSGHLKIVVTVENTTGTPKVLEFQNDQGETVSKEAVIFTPYVVSLSGWKFDNRYFDNVTAPGVGGESPEGVVTDVQGVTTVSWTIPLIPPSYPSKQYAVLEADGRNIQLDSFDIAIIPVLPESSQTDSLSGIKTAFEKLYSGFESIEQGVGAESKPDTLLYGFNTLLKGLGNERAEGTVINGLRQISSGIDSLYSNLVKIRMGIATPGFDPATFNAAQGKDAGGRSPGAKDAIDLVRSSVDKQLIPAVDAQQQLVAGLNGVIGNPADVGQTPSATTSLYNDINTLKSLAGSGPAADLISKAIIPKINVLSGNLSALEKGGQITTSAGQVDFPASLVAVKAGLGQVNDSLARTSAGLDQVVQGLGDVKADGTPVPVLLEGKPGTILFAMATIKDGSDALYQGVSGQVVPGLKKMQSGVAQIGEGASTAKVSLAAGLVDLSSAGAIKDSLKANVEAVDTFLGKPDGAQGSVIYVFRTAPVKPAAGGLTNGLIALVVLLGLLAALGRGQSTPVKMEA